MLDKNLERMRVLQPDLVVVTERLALCHSNPSFQKSESL